MKKILPVIILLIFLTGCDNRKCIESHKEQSTCVYSIYNGRTVQPIVVPCSVTVCDKYEEEGE